jgi:hypothetical protein
MNLVLRYALFSILTIGLLSCSPGQPAETALPTVSGGALVTPASPTPDSLASTQSVSPTTLPVVSTPEAPLSQYKISANLDYDAHLLRIEEQITYFNNSIDKLPDLTLIVEPNRYPGAFNLNAISWKSGVTISNYSLDGPVLRIPLDSPLPPGGRLDLVLSFESNLPAQEAPYGYTERQTNLGDWYPYVPPYKSGEGWLIRERSGQGEHLSYEAMDFLVNFSLANPNSAGGQPLIIAASALPETAGETTQYRLQAGRTFALSISPLFLVRETLVGDVTIRSYTFPFHAAADEPALQETAKALAVFSEILSPYPHASLSVVEADFLNGMEYDGLIFLSHAFYEFYTGDQKSNLTIIAAHEVAHQWWYGLVGNDQANEPWLDEALSTYSELLYYERMYPQLASWWRENRIDFHEPQGWVDSTIYDFGPQDFYPYRNAVYLRGAMFLADLRQAMGDEPFILFLRDYLQQFSHRQSTGDDFFSVLARHTNTDLSGIIANYFANR